ncbi:hypothetical protein QUF90_06315 [Desulfococcaceae bacterium HSG9]|nr:hypothetical protein [Desulfococcaceae bacterium HSG9]
MKMMRMISIISVLLFYGSVCIAAGDESDQVKKDFGYVDKDEVSTGKEGVSGGLGYSLDSMIYWARVNNVIYYVAGFIVLLILRGFLKKRKQKKKNRIYT